MKDREPIYNKNLCISEEDVDLQDDVMTLNDWSIQVEKDIAYMEDQIAKEKFKASDKDWTARVQGAKHCQQILLKAIQNRINDLQTHHHDSLERAFMRVAFQQLPEDVYMSIEAQARDLQFNY